MKRKERGFTLLEMLVAIAIFSALAISAYGMLSGTQRADAVSERHAKKLSALQRAYFAFSRDFTQMAHRQMRLDGDQPEKRLLFVDREELASDSGSLLFTRHGWTNPFNQFPRGDVQRVAYRVQDKQLQRLDYLYPDILPGTEPRVRILLEGVTELKFEFYSGNDWQDKWGAAAQLPKALAVEFKSQDYGTIRWQFLTPSSAGAAKKGDDER